MNELIGAVLVGGLFLIYATPLIVAALRNHRQLMPIVVLNLFLGWTFFGWVAALIWALTADVKEIEA